MTRARSWRGIRIYTVGHSTRTLEELAALLRAFGVTVLVDVRTVPRSRHNPQFNADTLPSALRAEGLEYARIPRLGGFRRARKDSPNVAWRNASFRGFADHMLTEEFDAGLAELRDVATRGRVAIMCAEAVPWRCHRSLIADVLTARGAHVEHITGPSRASPHRMTSFAQVQGSRVIYPGEGEADDRLDTRAPFHLEATVRVLQRRPTNLVDVWREGCYMRALSTEDALVLLEVENRGSIDAPDLRYTLRAGNPSASTRRQLAATLRRVLGLDVDPAPLHRLAAAEPALRPTALALRGMRPPRFADLFEAFASVVPFQQVSLDAGLAVVGRVVERFGRHVDEGGRRYHIFPAAESIAEARLDTMRRCGLSRHKAESLHNIARLIASGELTEGSIAAMTTSEALGTLTELPGIGPWSAGLVLLRGLGRLDVFPQGDVGVARGLGKLLSLSSAAELSAIVERFGDLRGYLYFCSLGGGLLAKGLIHAARALE